MRTELFWLLSFCGFAAMSLVCGLLAWPHLSAVWPGIQEQIDRFHRLHPLAKVTLLVFIAGFIAYGSTKTNQVDQTSGTNIVEIVEGGTNDVEIVEGGTNGVEIVDGGETNAPSMMLMMTMPFFVDEPPTVTPEDIARGWQLLEVRTNFNISYTMPECATLATNWWLRGAYEDVKSFDFGDWRFPFGSNSYSSAWAFAWGKVRFALADTNTEIVVVGAPMSAVPYRSRLWSAADTNDSRLVTWENFSLNRDTNTPVNAQIELLATGDIVARSNEVEAVYRRVDPEDWDGDGWRNDDDPDPYAWEEYWDSFWQELPCGANENAYCWIEIRPRWNSYIEFVGDGPSDLDDPYLWAKAGETYRVQLLIGKTYFIESTQPLDVVGKSDSSIEVDGNGTCELEVVWPVRMSALESNGNGFRMVVRPSGLGGFFNWTDSCCTVYGSDQVFRYGCSGNCGCSGCTARGFYEYAGYRLEATGGSCGCSSDDDHPGEDTDDPPSVGVSVSFSERAIIFEDSYANTTNDIVPWNSTATELTCTINGGPNGGYVQIDSSGDDNLIQYTGYSLPYSRTLAPNERIEFTNRYKATVESSSEDDIEVTATFVENETGWVDESEAKATAVRVEVEAVSDEPECKYRHVYGVGERVYCKSFPENVQVQWSSSISGAIQNVFGVTLLECPFVAAPVGLTASCNGCVYGVSMTLREPEAIHCSNAIARDLGLSEDHAGGVGLDLELYIEPTTVSFYNLAVQEIPAEGSHEGYFNNLAFTNIWNHSKARRAGVWKAVSPNNFYMTDEAHLGDEMPRIKDGGSLTYEMGYGWSGGRITWPIPMGWQSRDACETDLPELKRMANSYQQVFRMTAEGTASVEKHGYKASRGTNDVVWLERGTEE